MDKSQKPTIIAKIKQSFEKSTAVFVINQNKMTVANSEDLRKQLRESSSQYLVCKNTLARLAVTGTTFENILPHLGGQLALIFSADITASAKIIDEYSTKNDGKISIICGGYDGKLLSTADVKMLAKLPKLDELRAKIIAIIQTPAQRLAVLQQAPATQLCRVLKAYAER
ncbi:MAG: 50S ribosomal protein L10 [Holosporaceae bacterium]|nr:50S ribosomal protein L10 [Holosporaceae bacterium]